MPQFLKEFKNPCFYSDVYRRLRCVPYFIIAGFPKTGSSDLWHRLIKHPDIIAEHVKEPNFYHKKRLVGSFTKTFEAYLTALDKTADKINRHVSPLGCQHDFPYYHAVTGDASVDYSFENLRWPQFPGNENCSEPVVTNADVAYHINPKTKIIFTLRDPVERLYSDYIYEARYVRYPTSPKHFHSAVKKQIQIHTDCIRRNSRRACAYNSTLEPYATRFRCGMYSIFIKDWIDVFGNDNVFVLKSEDTLGPNQTEIYDQLLKFLELRPFTPLESKEIFQLPAQNVRNRREKKLGDMLPETRKLIENFYLDYNKELADMYPNIDYNIR